MLALKLADIRGSQRGSVGQDPFGNPISNLLQLNNTKIKVLSSKESNFFTGGNYNMRVTALGRVKTTALEEHWI